MNQLVSVIIPCFNAEQWLKEAIDSCLKQSYPHIEVIVIDDGSTDQSLDIIKSYHKKIIWRSDINRGGNYARNQGLFLAQGQYLQFLDADDYLLSEKIEKQVAFLEKTQVDAVYGDLIIQYHQEKGEVATKNTHLFHNPHDSQAFLKHLIMDGSISPIPYLFRKQAILQCGGWDEHLRAGQDRDFLISLALSSAKIAYQPGFDSVYRRYGNVTVSTSNPTRLVECHYVTLEKAEVQLRQLQKLSSTYLWALLYAYASLFQKHSKFISWHLNIKLLSKIFLLSLHYFTKRLFI
jgi:glycosyltransferase involved in cell wall biosynthesis